jgi:cell division protein FtsB
MAKTAGAKRKVKWIRYVLVGLGVVGAYHIAVGPSGALNLISLRGENQERRRELDSLRERKQELEIEKVLLERDSAYLEKVARKDLGMARPDEKVFRYMVTDGEE